MTHNFEICESFPEFLMLMCKTEGIDGVKAAFQSYDTDGSGTITLVELRGVTVDY